MSGDWLRISLWTPGSKYEPMVRQQHKTRKKMEKKSVKSVNFATFLPLIRLLESSNAIFLTRSDVMHMHKPKLNYLIKTMEKTH